MRDRPNRPAHPKRRSRPAAPGRASRPAARRPAGGSSGAATRTSAPRPPGRFTGRAVVLAVVLLVLALSYVLPLRIYLGQQAEMSQLRDSQSAQRDHIAELETEAARWADDEYVRIQARKRLHLVEPGEVPMIVVWDDAAFDDGDREPGRVSSGHTPWWQSLWSGVRAADRGEHGPLWPDGAPAGDDPNEADSAGGRAGG